jgi:hypothetical protein
LKITVLEPSTDAIGERAIPSSARRATAHTKRKK